MKKLILSLFIFCSVLLQAQIQIPQVVGLTSTLNSKVDKVNGKSLVADTLSAKIQPHVSNLSNPHAVTKTQVGLGNVDNTSDINKPVSLAQKAALNLKQTVFTGICQEQFLTENDIVIDNTALTLTIATVKNGQPISALNPICFYTDGNGVAVKHEKSTPVVFNFTNTDGIWYFYFNSSGNPIATQTSWSDFSTMASVYRFYWNSTLAVPERRVIESVEYHKNDISWADHMWKHAEGTKYLSGFNISHNATVSATPNIDGSNAVVTLSSGSNIDDNMEYSVTHAASGSVKFTQNLGTGLLPATSGKFICISNDASLKLQKIPATDFPFLWNPTTNIPQYLTATGVRTDVGNGYFFVYYIYALQDPRYGEAIKIKSSETDFASSTLAAAHNWEQLQAIFPTLRDGEIRLLYKLTFEYKSAYNIGTKKAALRVVDDLRKQKTTTTATAGGLLPATSVVVSPIGNIASTNVQSALQELDSEKQPVGTYSTDIHSNTTALNDVLGSNHGDETTTSIKTKLGAATAVSDGYLKYQDFVRFDGKQPAGAYLTAEVDGSVTNELQTISTTGAAGNITLSNSGGTLNLNVNDADASPTNEIQDLSLSGNMLTLSSDAPVDISQATAVQANTAKVSNATHTGDVTGSTALTLATVNGSIGTFNNVTINAKGLATAGSNVSYEPSFSKNTAFNKNFGTTPGTVLEGRTFGTAANSAVGDFVQINPASAQLGNVWINGGVRVDNSIASQLNGSDIVGAGARFGLLNSAGNRFMIHQLNASNGEDIWSSDGTSYRNVYSLSYLGAATFSSTVNSTGFLLNGNNLTSSLTTNHIPKWNGSTMVNSLISDDGNNAKLGTGTPFTTGAKFNIIGTTHGLISQTSGAWGAVLKNTTTNLECDLAGAGDVSVQTNGRIVTTATTTSTSPTTGALVVSGGVGADHVRANNFYGNGSNLTGVQLPITLTTNGTSGAATFENGVMNVPNYGNVATSGTYVPALTNYSNIASSSAFEAMYMHIGNMYSLSIKAAITPSTAGSCTLRITLPQRSNNKTGVFSVTSISNNQSTVLPSFTYTVGGADYVGVVVNVPSTDPITLTVTGMYTHQ